MVSRKQINKILLTIYFIINPKWWSMNYDYNDKWDQELNHLLDNYKLSGFDGFNGYLNGVGVWLRNYPYAYAERNYRRPSRFTIYRLRQREKLDRLTKSELRELKLKKLLND
jgi:hypothetical protein